MTILDAKEFSYLDIDGITAIEELHVAAATQDSQKFFITKIVIDKSTKVIKEKYSLQAYFKNPQFDRKAKIVGIYHKTTNNITLLV